MTAVVVLERADEGWSVLSASHAVTSATGWQPEALIGSSWPPFLRRGTELDNVLRASLDAGRPMAVEGEVLDPEGAAMSAYIEMIPGADRRHAVCLLAPAGATRVSGLQDPLTGVGNRALLERDLGLALSRAGRSGHAVAVIFIDLDGFKRVNDRYGHAAGDEVLREVARRLTANVRAHDVVVRLGGDEFVLVLSDLPEDRARVSAEVVIDHVHDALTAPIAIDDRHVVVGGSVGLAVYPDEGAHEEDLLAAADAGMYKAKRAREALGADARADLIHRARRAEEHAATLRRSTDVILQAARATMSERPPRGGPDRPAPSRRFAP